MTQAPATPPRPFADAVLEYHRAGWPCIVPVPAETKFPPPTGFTGAQGRDTDPVQLATWVAERPTASIALRMPLVEPDPATGHPGWCVIGIDVDDYTKTSEAGVATTKRGATTLASFEAQWGPLPPTWVSTARGAEVGAGNSRILLFLAPPQRYTTRLTDGTTGDVEIIQRHHRYAVVWPSPHAGVLDSVTGEPSNYRWYGPDDRPTTRPPMPAELTWLPQAWVDGLAEGATTAAAEPADRSSGEALLEQLTSDWRPACRELASVHDYAISVVQRADAGSRHDSMTERVHQIVQMSAQGHAGAAHAIAALRLLWAQLTVGEGREGEFERMLLTSARKAVSSYGAVQVPTDPCQLMIAHTGVLAGWPGPGPLPGEENPVGAVNGSGEPVPLDPVTGEPVDQQHVIVEPPRWSSVQQVIGAEAFDPNAGVDQALAEAVLKRTWPALRYAYDANSWLLRAPDHWEEHGRLSPWAVAALAPLMPLGDPTADKGTEQHERSKRRTRLMSTPGARAIASKMDDLVAGGMHPVALALGELDSDPEVLWAGGMPYDLRGSSQGPAFADLDPATPHIRTAGVTPDVRQTPLFDAFLAAVIPDEALRTWALRVLSIAVTGYADRALLILLGETGRGKTQLIHLLASTLGTYAHSANPKLLSPNTSEHDTIIYDLKGRRLSFIDEGPSERKAGQERLKQLTGGGNLTGRQMNQDPITFPASHTLALTVNEEPLLTDPAVRSRARLIPCNGDPDLVRATRAAIGHVSGPAWRREAPGVLALLMREAAGWLDDPSTALTEAAPEHVRYLAENLGAEQDPVAVWVREECEPWPDGTPARELYHAFVQSCRNGLVRMDHVPSETKWGRQMTSLGYPAAHTAHGKRRPVRVRPQDFWGPTVTPTPTVGSALTSSPLQAVSKPSGSRQPEGAGATGADGFGQIADGSLTASTTHPSDTNLQVNPEISVTTDGLTGSEGVTHMRNPVLDPPPVLPDEIVVATPTPIRQPVSGGAATAGAATPPKPRTPKAEAAREKAAAAKAERKTAAIAEAAGPLLDLPALLARMPDGTVQVLPCDAMIADRLLSTITTPDAGSASQPLTVDVEHTGYPIGHELYELRTVQLGNESFAVVLDHHDLEQAAVITKHLAAAPVLHAHSATADLVPLCTAGLADHDDVWSKMLDTGILAKLADPSSTKNADDLKGLAKAVLGGSALSPASDEARAALFKAGGWLTDAKVTTPVERSGWAQVDARSTTMIRYAAADVLDDAALAQRLPRPEPRVLERELMAQRMTARVTHEGVRLHGAQIATLLEQHGTARTELAAQVRELGSAGAPTGAELANPGSSQQVAAAFERLGVNLPRTKAGKPSVAKGVLEPMRRLEGHVGDLVRSVLDWRHHNTALTLLLEPWHELVLRGDGRARPTVYTLGADTGRMSCVRPNVQQVSREGGMRSCFTADPGELMISVDFAGVELRVAAALSQDANLAAIMNDPNRDLHMEVAQLAFGPKATKSDRYAIKRGVFGRIYGGGLAAVAAGVGVSHPVAQQVIDAMDQLTPGLSAWSNRVRDGVKLGHTQFPSYAGRIIHMPKAAPHAAPNYCIQGTARELLIDALERWSRTRWGGCRLFPVHDELVVFVPEAEAAEATAALVECMTTDLFGVPIIAEASEPSFEWKDSA